MSRAKIFLSMGTPYTEKYVRFRDALEITMNNRCNVDTRIIGRNEYPSGNPINKIREVMRKCDGVLVVAYERMLVKTGTEKPGGEAERVIANESFTTPWNHVESAIAFGMDLPILIICENGIREEGLLESKADWYIHYMKFLPSELEQPSTIELLKAWVENRVKPKQKARTKIFGLSESSRLSDVTLGNWILLGSMISAAFGAGAFAEKLAPALFGK